MNRTDTAVTTQIVDLIPKHAKVLDLGCGEGTLLNALIQKKEIQGYGIEIDHEKVTSCVKKGLSVFQGNLDEGLSGFSEQFYDVVILSLTLQQVRDPKLVLREMLRIGKKAIITFPNFAHLSCRLQLLRGRIPQSRELPYSWHDTPNIRVISIHAFKQLCEENQITILKEIPLFKPTLFNTLFSPIFPNLCCEKGMFVIQSN